MPESETSDSAQVSSVDAASEESVPDKTIPAATVPDTTTPAATAPTATAPTATAPAATTSDKQATAGKQTDFSAAFEQDGVAYARTDLQEADGAVQEKAADSSAASVAEKQKVPENLYSAITYSNVYANTDLRYNLASDELKESLVINARPASQLGYQYFLKTDSLELTLQEDKSILAYAGNGTNDKPLLYMPAPFLEDHNGICSSDVSVTLEKGQGGYTLTYLLPQAWMTASERFYPVVLDPVIRPNSNTYTIRDQTVTELNQPNYRSQDLVAGYTSNYGRAHIYMKYWDLPALSSADVITSAQLSLCSFESSGNPVVEAHKVNSDWDSETINWSNKPSFNQTVEDYQVIQSNDWYNWDITSMAQQWFTGQNYGLMLSISAAVEAGDSNPWARFLSSDYAYADGLPVLSIIYINNCGLEDYWDYTTQDAGRAGTGYVNDFTGNLVWINDDMGFPGNRMPVTIKHVYSANDKRGNYFGFGRNWRTNYNQLVYKWSEDTNYYIWEDQDGTNHYFNYDSPGTYKDETQNSLVLTDTGTGRQSYCITDKDNNKSYFDTDGYLASIQNNQETVSSLQVYYTNEYAGVWLIDYVLDGAGRRYQFYWSTQVTGTDVLLTSIVFTGTSGQTISTVSYQYTGPLLTSITYPDNRSATYSYTTANLLGSATEVDGYQVNYTYNTTADTLPNRITHISQQDGSTQAGSLSIEYAHNQTTLTDQNGHKEIKQFNDWGNTVSTQNEEGKAQFAKYDRNEGNGTGRLNQLNLASKLQNTVGNMAYNGSFEVATAWATNPGCPYGSNWDFTSSDHYLGTSCIYMTPPSNGALVVARPFTEDCYPVRPGYTYTLSAYVKTINMTSGGGSGAQIGIGPISSTTASVVSDSIKSNTNGWTRLEVTYTHPSGAAATNVVPYLRCSSTGTAYFDCVQFEEAPSASRYNLLENGDFRYAGSESTGAYSWDAYGMNTSSDVRTTVSKSAGTELDTHALRINGTPTEHRFVYTAVPVSGAIGDCYTLSGWAKTDSVPINGSTSFSLLLRFFNTDGTQTDQRVLFNPDTDSTVSWQYAACQAVADKPYNSITVYIEYGYNENTAYFDGIQLFKEMFGSSYTYDADGNVISVVDLQNKTTSYQYTNNNLTKMTLPSGASQEYEYDTYHNVTKATSPTGVTASFAYDTYGNNTSVTLGSSTKKISSSATYTADGNQLSTVTDERGNITSYSYNTQTGVLEWKRAPGETSVTRTNYAHDSLYRTTSVSRTPSGAAATSVSYGYNNDMLSTISTAGGTNYSLVKA